MERPLVQILVVVATILERFNFVKGVFRSNSQGANNLEDRSGEGFLLNGNHRRVSRS